MKTRLLILIICLIPLFACDKTPKPRNRAERNMFVQADRDFNTLMLPLDKYFERNGAADEIQNFKKLKNDYNSAIKNALLQTDPAARDAALRAADDKYMPYINELRAMLRQRAAAKRNLQDPAASADAKDRPRRPVKPVALIIGGSISNGAHAPEMLEYILNDNKPFLSGEAGAYSATQNPAQYINSDYDYTLRRLNGMFERLKAAAPDLDGVLTPMQNGAYAGITNIKEAALAAGADAAAPARYESERNKLLADVNNKIESVIDGRRALKKKDFLDKAAAEFDAQVLPLANKIKQDYRSDALTAKFTASATVIKNEMKEALGGEPDPAKQKKIKETAYAKAVDCKDSAYVEGNVAGSIEQINNNYFNSTFSTIKFYSGKGVNLDPEKKQLENLQARCTEAVKNLGGKAVAMPMGTDKNAYFQNNMDAAIAPFSQEFDVIKTAVKKKIDAAGNIQQ
ncbi:MAG: hypothetical protein LBI01_04285 [Elusimicrobium sp.]|jgi:hypothetical protein|nr:hypothetical protein [Elusimicrobium sp.]